MVLILSCIYTLLQRPNKNTNSLNNEHVNKEQTIIDSSSIISSSDNTYLHIQFLLFFRALINARYSTKVNEWTLLSMTYCTKKNHYVWLCGG
ncbi:unnamed protein product [Rotaria sp. Silwood1]|nr:unnamed protein product [Rotaria sp. Silwood1]CAF1651444.1 unnamed protein product [Rotaria sp. Silwood1]